MKKVPITRFAEVEEIFKKEQVCTMAMVDEGMPYAVPMNFGYSDGFLYFHGAPVGKRIDIFKKNPNVCVSFYSDAVMNLRHEKVACSYSMKFRSVLVFGALEEVIDIDEKKDIMNIIMKHYTDRDDFSYNIPAITNVQMFKLKVDNYTAQKRGY
jgi:hypothetical protein